MEEVCPFFSGVFFGAEKVTVIVGLVWPSCVIQVATTGEKPHFFNVICKLSAITIAHESRLGSPSGSADILNEPVSEGIPRVAWSLGIFAPKNSFREWRLKSILNQCWLSFCFLIRSSFSICLYMIGMTSSKVPEADT